MALAQMIAEMRGVVPGYSALLARIHLRESWNEIRRMRGWSFQLAQGGFSTPPRINAGEATVTWGSPDVTFDAQASAAILTNGSIYGSLITQRQFRIGASSIYNIISSGDTGSVSFVNITDPGSGQTPGIYTVPVTDAADPDGGSGGSVQITVNVDGTVTQPVTILSAGTNYVTPLVILAAGGTPATFAAFNGVLLTLDRPWTDVTTPTPELPPTTSTLGYSIYQCYYPAPSATFQAWEGMMDMVNVIWLKTSPSKLERDRINRADPQRQIFTNPQTVLSVGADARPGSSTLGWMMFELYPQPQSIYSYQTWYSFDGPELSSPTDTLPFPVTENCLKARARAKAYEWAEANRDVTNPRGQASDYRFLIGSAMREFNDTLHEIRMLDRDLIDVWNYRLTRLSGIGPLATFDPSTGAVLSRNM